MTGQAKPSVTTVPQNGEVELGAAPAQSISAALLRSVFREERFFLVLSVFIGIFSGLAVVCFRFAIEWCRVHFLGSELIASPARLLLAPSLAGLVIAVLVIHVFPGARAAA